MESECYRDANWPSAYAALSLPFFYIRLRRFRSLTHDWVWFQKRAEHWKMYEIIYFIFAASERLSCPFLFHSQKLYLNCFTIIQQCISVLQLRAAVVERKFEGALHSSHTWWLLSLFFIHPEDPLNWSLPQWIHTTHSSTSRIINRPSR